MKNCLVFIVFLCGFVPFVNATDGDGKRLSREEFREKQKSFIIEQVGLSQEEAAKFFPLYFELQDKKKKLSDASWKLMRQGEDEKTTEEQYGKIMETVCDNSIAADKLEKEYQAKFKEVISNKKIYLVQRAEMRFHRMMLRGMNRPEKRK